MEDLFRGWLDRELLVASTLHDLRGPVAALQGLVELLGPECPEMVSRIAARLFRQLESFPLQAQQLHPADLGDVLGLPIRAPVLLRIPPAMLRYAVQQVPHGTVTVAVEEKIVVLRLTDVSETDWSPDTRNPTAGARLRVAARLAGALSQRYLGESVVGTVQIRFPLRAEMVNSSLDRSRVEQAS